MHEKQLRLAVSRHTLRTWCAVMLAGMALCNQASADTIPDTGLYVQQIFTDKELTTYVDQRYSVRPNPHGQYTSSKTKAIEQDMKVLKLKLDITVPPNATANAPQPLLVWIHGGGYKAGDKSHPWDMAATYARAGYVVASVNYRLTADNQSCDAMREIALKDANEDVMNAIRYLKANAEAFHIDTTRIATVGTSAGGGISLVNAIEFDTLAGTVSDRPHLSSKVAAAISTGASLVDPSSGIDSDQLLHYDANDTPVLLFHAKPTDGGTGATWEDNVVPTMDRINGSGNTGYAIAQPDMTHTVDLSLGGKYWQYMKPFLWTTLRLGELRR